MKQLVIDMNLVPAWTQVFARHGWAAVHWSSIGDPRAADQTIMEWARLHDAIVFTHDLDFGTMLALTHAAGPSVIQVRTQDVFPAFLEPILIPVLRQFEAELDAGALIVVDAGRSRVRLLPLGQT